MGFLNRLFGQKPDRYGGIIGYLGLSDWWGQLSEEERRFLRACFARGVSVGGFVNPRMLDKGNAATSQTPEGFLNGLGLWALAEHNYALADKCLQEALRLGFNVIDQHFTYLHLIDTCYKQRDKEPEWVERCAEYCRRDIDLFPAFKEAWINEERKSLLKMSRDPFYTAEERKRYRAEAKKEIPFNLHIPSFARLAIIYEKQGRFDEAIKVCDMAISYGVFGDGTKGGFTERRKRLEKKLIDQRHE